MVLNVYVIMGLYRKAEAELQELFRCAIRMDQDTHARVVWIRCFKIR